MANKHTNCSTCARRERCDAECMGYISDSETGSERDDWELLAADAARE